MNHCGRGSLDKIQKRREIEILSWLRDCMSVHVKGKKRRGKIHAKKFWLL